MVDIIFSIIILLFSVVIHEVSHGFMAEYFGDDTARNEGRLTLNPVSHIDPIGSIVLPILLVMSHLPFFAWAKPVPYNPRNLRDLKWGTFWVAFAGVLANIFIAVVFSIVIRIGSHYQLPASFYFITSSIVVVNLALAIFNLIPIPPLDGSKILFSLLPHRFFGYLLILEQYSFVVLLVFVFFFASYLTPVLSFLFKLFTGFSLALG